MTDRLFEFLRYRVRHFKIGGSDLSVVVPRNINATSPHDDVALPMSALVWPSSPVLANHLVEADVRGMRVLDIGCGVGLVSLYLCSRGAIVTAVDIAPGIEPLIQKSAKRNGIIAPEVHVTDWHSLALDPFDLVVASDVLYEPAHLLTLPGCIDRHSRLGTEVFVVDPDRGHGEHFCELMAGFGFDRQPLYDQGIEAVPDFQGTTYRFTRK